MPRLLEPMAGGAGTLGPVIGLVTDRMDWHARALDKAFAALGARAVPFDLAACRIETAAAHGLHLPGFEGRLPDAVLVRTLSGGSFEAVTLRLGVLHALSALDVPVWNNARAIERCVDNLIILHFQFNGQFVATERVVVVVVNVSRFQMTLAPRMFIVVEDFLAI